MWQLYTDTKRVTQTNYYNKNSNFCYNLEDIICQFFSHAVKPVFNDYPWDPNIVAIVDRLSLIRDHLSNEISNWDFKRLQTGGCNL